MKAQRLKITEKGWATFSDYYGGIKFTNGISDEAVSPQVAAQIGSYIRIEAIDDGAQVGESTVYGKGKNAKAPVKKALVDETPHTEAPEVAAKKQVEKTRYTKESLEAIADQSGIGGLRVIAEQYGVKGRGIVELITEILKAQG